jgi:rhodanese-related sulfurtransferase
VISQIDAPDLQQAIQSGRALALLDVREPWEFATAQIAGTTNIPMSSISGRVDEIRNMQGEGDLVVICHHGTRSMYVAQFLATQGVDSLVNLRGGIDAWSRQVDASVPLY